MIHNSGIGVYIRQYIRHILEADQYMITLLGRRTELDRHFGMFTNWQHIEADFPIYSVQEQLKLPFLVPECDIFWSPHYNIPLLPIRARKHLATIPDVFHLAFYHTLSAAQKVYAKVVANAAVRKPDLVTTISHYSKQEIVSLTGGRADKIKVIHLGIDQALFRPVTDLATRQRVREQYQLPDRFILFVGNVKPNKNLRSLVEAFSTLLTELPDVYLMIVGKKEGFITLDSSLFERIEADPALAERVRFTGYVETNDLPVLYSLATLFAFPSIYEGFGFPPLEAMACGCPVVASKVTSIPEICGDAVYYVDPLSPASIAEGLRAVATDEGLQKRLVEAGNHQYRQYNWQHSSNQFIETINELV
ncbi:glycosyltransferase family 4 protein [Spirosoma taeanense]|nr:glycosyltransferase family 1 protein [Spirosoma taeanense]